MIFRFWHLDPWDTALRGKIELPSWPYYYSKLGPPPEDLLQYLQNLSVIRIEIEGYANKLIIPLPEGSVHLEGKTDPWANKWRKPWICYHTHGDFDPDTFAIKKWDMEYNDYTRPYFEKYVGKTVPDFFSWYSWNEKKMIKVMDSAGVLYG